VDSADFQELLQGARVGQDEAWAAIYEDLAPALLGYLRAQRAAEPEDLLGEVFLQMVRDIAGFAGDRGRFRAWAFAIAHHRLIDDRRYRARRPVQPASAEVLAESQRQYRLAESEAVVDRRVAGALRRLPEDQRTVILLRVLGDLSVSDVARMLGKTPGAVKAAQRRAFATLKRQLTKLTVTL
jgi:RNA polymerase sigma factor (sigma-70 family)